MLFRCAPVTYTTGVGGDVAQLGERRTRIAEVVGSNPIVSTTKALMDAGFVRPPHDRRPRKAEMVLNDTLRVGIADMKYDDPMDSRTTASARRYGDERCGCECMGAPTEEVA